MGMIPPQIPKGKNGCRKFGGQGNGVCSDEGRRSFVRSHDDDDDSGLGLCLSSEGIGLGWGVGGGLGLSLDGGGIGWMF